MSDAGFEADGISSFDLIVVGAGVSGLCLVKTWLASETTFRSILVIDGAKDDDQLRTLSFWSETKSIFEPLVRFGWKTLRLVDASNSFELPLHTMIYRTLFWADLQREVLAEVRNTIRSKVVDGRVKEIVDRGDCVSVWVGEEEFRGRWVMDSRFRLADLEVDTRLWHPLKQYFTGWLVRAPEGSFDPSGATLFDFRTGLQEGRAFFYVLPFSTQEALVELVTLDRQEATPVLERYLEEHLRIPSYEIVAREHGTSPMTEQPFSHAASPRIRRLGIAAGMLKPSTGYAFTRIEEDCKAIVASLIKDGNPMVPTKSRPLYRFLDGVLLEVWDQRPELLPGIFRTLFLKNPADRVLRFLDEKAGFWQMIRLIWTLPFAPFVRATLGWLKRRWLGR